MGYACRAPGRGNHQVAIVRLPARRFVLAVCPPPLQLIAARPPSVRWALTAHENDLILRDLII
jgi:hypothetical protein